MIGWQVDLNVTRHLEAELTKDDWDITILHYLGLDHIGHLAGPSSPLVEPKLNEMSDVIKQVYEELVKKPWKTPPMVINLRKLVRNSCTNHSYSVPRFLCLVTTACRMLAATEEPQSRRS